MACCLSTPETLAARRIQECTARAGAKNSILTSHLITHTVTHTLPRPLSARYSTSRHPRLSTTHRSTTPAAGLQRVSNPLSQIRSAATRPGALGSRIRDSRAGPGRQQPRSEETKKQILGKAKMRKEGRSRLSDGMNGWQDRKDRMVM